MTMTLQRGQTLLELLVAFTVIAVGLFAAVTLVFSNLNAVQRDSDEVVAVNLVREGAELAKQLRDSNWLMGKNFDAGMENPFDVNDWTVTPVWDGAPSRVLPPFDFSANDFTHPNTQIVQTRDKVFANAFASDISGASTPFRRLMTFSHICYDDSISPGTYSFPTTPDPCLPPKRKVGVRVTSHVRWMRKTVTRDSIITEDLYDWR